MCSTVITTLIHGSTGVPNRQQTQSISLILYISAKLVSVANLHEYKVVRTYQIFPEIKKSEKPGLAFLT